MLSADINIQTSTTKILQPNNTLDQIEPKLLIMKFSESHLHIFLFFIAHYFTAITYKMVSGESGIHQWESNRTIMTELSRCAALQLSQQKQCCKLESLSNKSS